MVDRPLKRDAKELPDLDRIACELAGINLTRVPVVRRKQIRKLTRDVAVLLRQSAGTACSHCFNSDRRDGSTDYCDECECLKSNIEEIELDELIRDSSKSYDERMSAARRRMARQGGPTLRELKQEWKRRKFKWT